MLHRTYRRTMIALYSQATAFVFPSRTEGFGIPILEAMVCGTPVIASDRGAIPEVVGDAALLADAEDAAALARHLETVLTLPAEADRLRQRGLARARHFSWRDNARRTLAVYEDALRGSVQSSHAHAADRLP
jgi:glycosyltransferase involved in cell wall biosynthesis